MFHHVMPRKEYSEEEALRCHSWTNRDSDNNGSHSKHFPMQLPVYLRAG